MPFSGFQELLRETQQTTCLFPDLSPNGTPQQKGAVSYVQLPSTEVGSQRGVPFVEWKNEFSRD